jgi:hypothetical protein
MPSLLLTDDAIAVMPQVDCTLLAVAVGQTLASDIAACKNHLDPDRLVRLVVKEG